MEEKIAQLREKTHLDIPIVILSIMFSLSLDKFSFTLFHVLFVLLIITIILSKTLPWNLITFLSKKNNYLVIISTYLQILLLFVIYYSFGLNPTVASLFYVGYALFLTLYVVLLCIQLMKFGAIHTAFSVEHAWAVGLFILHSAFFALAIILSSTSWGIEILVLLNIFLIPLVGYIFEGYAATELNVVHVEEEA